MKFTFIDAERARYGIVLLCRVLEVSRSGYYAWKARPASTRRRSDRRLAVEIKAIHKRSRGRYGSPRVHAELQAQGHRVSRKRVERLMREDGIRVRSRRAFRRTTDSRHRHPIAGNTLERVFTATAPNVVWVTDMTYIHTLDGWLYLAVMLDLFSRRVVGWAMSERIDRQLALDALDHALSQRRPSKGLLHHSDRGSQYASGDYRAALDARGITCSMSRKGNCWDNAVAESFFSTLKHEEVPTNGYETRAIARASIHEYIENFYNLTRRHSHNDYLSPIEYELRAQSSASVVQSPVH